MDIQAVTFRKYEDPSCTVPIEIITPDDGFYIHTFFDIDPISPSGRYAAILKIPFQDRVPAHDDAAEICIVDRKKHTIRKLCTTYAWGTQVGAHLCWGKTDQQLFFNIKREGNVFAASYNIYTDAYREFEGPVYMPTDDGLYLFGPNLALINYSQEGYGATMDPAYGLTPSEDLDACEGLWRTDTATGEKKLIVTIKQVYELLPDTSRFTGGRFVFFHTKVHSGQKRILQVVRYCRSDSQLRFIVTCGYNGEDLKIALPYEMWMPGSHHPDWHPDGKRILMNLRYGDIRFCIFGDGFKSFEILLPHLHGGGHPSISRDGRFLVSDAYTHEREFVDRHNRVPIRLIDLKTGVETELCRVFTLGGSDIPQENRCDPHPAWSRSGRELSFNAAPFGKKLVMIADMSKII